MHVSAAADHSIPAAQLDGQPRTRGHGGLNLAGAAADSPKRVRPLGSGKVGAKQLKRTDRTLCFFMLALQGHDVVVELRAGTFLKGTVYVADVHWKCAMPGSVHASSALVCQACRQRDALCRCERRAGGAGACAASEPCAKKSTRGA